MKHCLFNLNKRKQHKHTNASTRNKQIQQRAFKQGLSVCAPTM
jgi:hypothetical protein